MKIACFVDKEGSAIHRLAMMNKRRFPHLQYEVVPFHPKRPSAEEIAAVKNAIQDADLLDGHYWKTAVAIRKMFPETNVRPWILTHQNEHNVVGHWEWMDMKWDAHVVKNKYQKAELEKIGLKPTFIRHACEFGHFSFVPRLTKDKNVLYVGQIKKVKGVREIAQACRELGYKLTIVGKISEAEYFAEMQKEGVTFAQDVPDYEMDMMYQMSRVFVCNSDDGTESGTLPILEAMVVGIPVVTRNIGHVRDMGQHKKNMWIRDGHYADVEELKVAIQTVMENEDIANELRENAWRTVRQYHPDIHAREYNTLFHRVLFAAPLDRVNHNQPIVSIVMPTFNRAEVLEQNIKSINAEQTYKNIEIVVCDDGSIDKTQEVVRAAQARGGFPLRYIDTGNTEGYGLAMARNMGIIEAIGDILVFCDDRLKMHPSAVEAFVKSLVRHRDERHKAWVWGSKGQFKTFVENFSAIYRRDIINAGMFNERINEYGGMTQEVSNRFSAQGFIFDWCPQALAEPLVKTHSKSGNRESIIRSKIKLYKLGFQ